ncbi:hypothetical protein AB0K43_09185 [Kitasatospora sp. NPDC049258]|uniref:hypothetical protein n=1 Tax=Kitasatospora sp. NPDC049258 TaxID=3155394 RepID=UPI00342AE311
MTAPAPNWLGHLSDEERVLQDEAAAVERARGLLARPTDEDPEPLFVAANLIALVHFRLGELEQARALCRAETAHGRRRASGGSPAKLAALALQPQVNLVRIEGYAGDLDRALAALAALERIADGLPARTADLDWWPQDLAADPALARRIRALARNVRVSDTCKILYRRARADLLAPAAARFTARWPALAAQGIQHAAETPWLLGTEEAEPPGPAALTDPDPMARRLAVVRTLHLTAHAAERGERQRVVDLAGPLVEAVGSLPGPWASPLTVPRWWAVLGAALQRADRERQGRILLRAALAEARGDAPLVRGVLLRLGEPAPPRPSAPAGLDKVTRQLHAALAPQRSRAGV